MVRSPSHGADSSHHSERATFWRQRASKLMSIAGAVDNAHVQASLVHQAEQWRRMAEQAEGQAQGQVRSAAESGLRSFLALMQAELGNVQLLDRRTNTLRIVAHKGFDEKFLEDFKIVDAGSGCACGRALRTGAVVFVPDVENDGAFACLRPAALRAGFRAVISVPLRTKRHGVAGVISAHYRAPTTFTGAVQAAAEAYGEVAGDILEEAIPEQS